MRRNILTLPRLVHSEQGAQGSEQEGVTFLLFAEPELRPPDKTDFSEPQDIKDIKRDLKNGNRAAWFYARCVAVRGKCQGTDGLGGCSYHTFEEFVKEEEGATGYWSDLKNVAFEELKKAEEQQ